MASPAAISTIKRRRPACGAVGGESVEPVMCGLLHKPLPTYAENCTNSTVPLTSLSAKLKYYSNLCCNNMLFDPRFASLLNCWKGRSTAARRAMARRNGERLVAATIDLTATPTPQARPWWTHLYVQVLGAIRSEEHTSELQSLMRISYAVFCLKTNLI